MDRLFALRAPAIIVFNILLLHVAGYILQQYSFSDSPWMVWLVVAIVDMYFGLKCGRHVQQLFRDQMTGLHNRSFLAIFMAKALKRLQLKKEPVSLLMLDIDNFKLINDRYGHLVGDVVIRQVATALRQWSRSTDCAVRWGGEEFIIVLSATRLEEAASIAETLRQYIEQRNLYIGSKSKHLKVTISIGLACATEPIDSDCLIERADKALYEAKQNRNSVAVYSN